MAFVDTSQFPLHQGTLIVSLSPSQRHTTDARGPFCDELTRLTMPIGVQQLMSQIMSAVNLGPSGKDAFGTDKRRTTKMGPIPNLDLI